MCDHIGYSKRSPRKHHDPAPVLSTNSTEQEKSLQEFSKESNNHINKSETEKKVVFSSSTFYLAVLALALTTIVVYVCVRYCKGRGTHRELVVEPRRIGKEYS